MKNARSVRGILRSPDKNEPAEISVMPGTAATAAVADDEADAPVAPETAAARLSSAVVVRRLEREGVSPSPRAPEDDPVAEGAEGRSRPQAGQCWLWPGLGNSSPQPEQGRARRAQG